MTILMVEYILLLFTGGSDQLIKTPPNRRNNIQDITYVTNPKNSKRQSSSARYKKIPI
jgi:hypothetical protein